MFWAVFGHGSVMNSAGILACWCRITAGASVTRAVITKTPGNHRKHATVADVAQRVGLAINAIKKRAAICGDIESAVHRSIPTAKGPMAWEQGSLQIVRCSPEELNEHNQDQRVFATILQGASISVTSLLFPTPS
jgi:hypothetical protein